MPGRWMLLGMMRPNVRPKPQSAQVRAAKADVAQLAERVLGKDEVTSSILVIGSSLRSRDRQATFGWRATRVRRGVHRRAIAQVGSRGKPDESWPGAKADDNDVDRELRT